MIYDYIIVGSGVAGLNTARLLPKDKKVLILAKMLPWNSNTFWAQGGIAAAKNKDDVELHIKDTLEAGAFYNNYEAVKTLSENSLLVIDELIKSGMQFDKDKDGNVKDYCRIEALEYKGWGKSEWIGISIIDLNVIFFKSFLNKI